jgi:hypothetical protein
MSYMKPDDSRAIAADMQKPPYKDLTFGQRRQIVDMCYNHKIITFDQYIFQRDRLLKKSKDEKDKNFFR